VLLIIIIRIIIKIKIIIITAMGIIPNKLHEILKLFNLGPPLYIVTHKPITFNSLVRKFSAEKRTKSAWSVNPVRIWELTKKCG
jgi:hypothetical protein